MAVNKSKRSGIVSGYIKLWPREVLQLIGDQPKKKLLVNELKLLREPGVYILYRDDQPYYVGKATKTLFKRLHDHANKVTDDYFQFWNRFSAFVIKNPRHIGPVEGILINAMPTANGAKPRMKKIRVPPEVVKRLRKSGVSM